MGLESQSGQQKRNELIKSWTEAATLVEKFREGRR